jgi:diphthine-ammonia ligase
MYDDDDDDEEEVEDLYALLKYMRQLYPEVTAVSCGAILSTYQRTRFEHVCSRLSLIPLAFLWRRAPQASLLREMLQLNQNKDHIHNHPPNATPMQAIVVKTASMGLSSRHLNRTLLDLLPHLQTIESKYGLHVCGEGGGYESLVLDCTIYRKRLILDQVQIMYPNKDDMDPSTAPAYLKII